MKRLPFVLVLSLLALTTVFVCGCSKNKDKEEPTPSEEPTQSFKDGVIPSRFAVAEGKYVHFSQGNLQYQASTNTWRFANHQWDFVGYMTEGNVYEKGVKCDNSELSDKYTGWIDLFCWGTSGWNSGAVAYQPWATSNAYADYYPGGNMDNDLTGAYANADWGVYNKISNGGNKAGLWRTLTIAEWEHLFNNSTCGHATVNGVHGYVLLPDAWSKPEDLDDFVKNPNNWTANVYSGQQWKDMELAGAVFLPSAGFRDGQAVVMAGEYGHYWSSSHADFNCARHIGFFEENAFMGWNFRNIARSVRLVQDVK